jgi:hypothetical protein
MSMHVSRLHTYWTPEQAAEMLELLDQLRDQLWETYGDQIIAYRMHDCRVTDIDSRQQRLDLEGEPF